MGADMARYCRVTNTTTYICSTAIQTKYYRSIALLPGEEILIRDELCNRAAFAQIGFLVEDAGNFPDRTEPAFGEAHDRVVNAIFEERPEETSWNPLLGYPTHESVGFEFPAGTIFESYVVGEQLIPGSPVPVEIKYRQRIQSCVQDPDGVTNAEWKILPFPGDNFVTIDDLEDAISQFGTADGGTYYTNGFDPTTQTIPAAPAGITDVKPGDSWTVTADGTFNGQPVSVGDTIVADILNPMNAPEFHIEYTGSPSTTDTTSPLFFDQFVAVDWAGGTVLSYPLGVHGISHTPGKPFDVQVFNDQGEEVWACTATNPVTGEVTVTTDGVSFPGSILISES